MFLDSNICISSFETFLSKPVLYPMHSDAIFMGSRLW